MKHIIEAEEHVIWLLPDTSEPGWRLRLEKAKGELAILVEERVLPEHVDKPFPNRILDKRDPLFLTYEIAQWLCSALQEALADGEW